MSDQAQSGKSQLTIVLGVVVLLSLVSTVSTLAMGAGISIRNVISLVLTLVLAYFAFTGKGWARITLGVLLIIGGALSLLGGLPLMVLSFLWGLILIAIGALYLVMGIVLLASKSIKAYQASLNTPGA